MPDPSASPVPFPGRTLKAGSTDAAGVRLVQTRLNQIGCGPVHADGVFGEETTGAVELFQARSIDKFGVPLKVDGQVGPMTWAALFGEQTVVPSTAATGPLSAAALRVAAAEIGVMEQPPGSNRGPRVDEYLRTVGLDPASGSFAWCAAFVYWCFSTASRTLSVANPVIRTAGVLDHWNKAGAQGVRRVTRDDATAQPSLVQPGMIFILGTSSGSGHTGLVERVDGVQLTTIEGNTNLGGSREGIGVFRRTARRIADINRGFVDYA
jgi:hypothetical protein